MSLLVGYGSSDEDEQNETAALSKVKVTTQDSEATLVSRSSVESNNKKTAPVEGPVASPAYPSQDTTIQEATDDQPPLSPYSANRAEVQALTMPRFPNFNIPRSPSPPAANSEEAAELTTRTRKFERFLELKKQGIHFNDRLESSPALRNPELLQKLADFAGISPEERYENTLGEAFAVPTRWPDGFLESLVASNEKSKRREKDGRTKLDFVPARRDKDDRTKLDHASRIRKS